MRAITKCLKWQLLTSSLRLMAMKNLTQHIDRKEYPELDLILWDRADRLIEPQDAFLKYEQRWRYIDQTCLTAKESWLIEYLTSTYGKGLFLVA